MIEGPLIGGLLNENGWNRTTAIHCFSHGGPWFLNGGPLTNMRDTKDPVFCIIYILELGFCPTTETYNFLESHLRVLAFKAELVIFH